MSLKQTVLQNRKRTKSVALQFISAAALLALGSAAASATEFNLAASGSQSINVPGAVGGVGIVADNFTQPAGTGVFEPFLTIDANGQTSTGTHVVEQGYNTDGFSNLYLDQLRPQWNRLLKVGDLATLTVNGQAYYGFLLDANEPGGNKSLISIDNLRVYTSGSDTTGTVQNNLANLDSLGTLRWAMNNPNQAGGNFNVANWVKLNAAQENVDAGSNVSNGGSGKSDMILYVPASSFAGAKASDYVWLYDLNGVHYDSDIDLAATAGFEEWRAVASLQTQTSVADGGSTLALLGIAMAVMGGLRRKF